MAASITASDRNNAASQNASGPDRREVMGDASTVIVSAIVVPPAKVKTLSANVAVPFFMSDGGVSELSWESFNIKFQPVRLRLRTGVAH
jgi:hypothetical protein